MSETVRAWIRAGSARSAICVVVMRIMAMILVGIDFVVECEMGSEGSGAV